MRQLQIVTHQSLIINVSIKVKFSCVQFAICKFLLFPENVLFTLLPEDFVIRGVVFQFWI